MRHASSSGCARTRARRSSSRRIAKAPRGGPAGSMPPGSTAARPPGQRRAAWFAAGRGRNRISVGTRSALLAPLPPPATLVLLDEHEAAHKPPGPPRIHSRDLLRQRAAIEGSRLLLLSATPSVESWWRADTEQGIRAGSRGCARGLRSSPPTREASCGTIPSPCRSREASRRRPAAGSARSSSSRDGPARSSARSAARSCVAASARSRWGSHARPGRSGAASARRPSRYRSVAPIAAAIVSRRSAGTPSAWQPQSPSASPGSRSREPIRALRSSSAPRRCSRTSRPATLGCVGIVALDDLLSMPDFRGGERAFQLAWAAAEAVAPGGRLVVQTLHPEHYAVQAVKDRDRTTFYKPELDLRAELGYPPFRRICVVSVRARGEARRARAHRRLRGRAARPRRTDRVSCGAGGDLGGEDRPLAIRHQGARGAAPTDRRRADALPRAETTGRRCGRSRDGSSVVMFARSAPVRASTAAPSDGQPKGDASIMARLSVRLYGDPILADGRGAGDGRDSRDQGDHRGHDGDHVASGRSRDSPPRRSASRSASW